MSLILFVCLNKVFLILKSLTADIKTFRLEEYATHLREKKKLQHIFSELKSFYGKNIPMDTNEDIYSIDRLWEKLDVSIQNRENLLDKALEKFENMNCTYERVSRENKSLNDNISHIQDKLNNVRMFFFFLLVLKTNSFNSLSRYLIA
jgi:hypothetical protein